MNIMENKHTKIDNNKIFIAEKELNLKFSDEYKEYLLNYGVASYCGHELTGLCDFQRLNVVNVTLEERNYNSLIPLEWYVVERANIDGIVIWQNVSGEIYLSRPYQEAVKIAESLEEYVRGGV